MTQALQIELAHTQGFCAGVASAIEVVEKALEKYGTPLYVRHHIVHNTSVIKDFEARGVIFVEALSDVPDDAHVIFSAHGTAPDVVENARQRNLHFIDATCPLVTKVHRQAVRFSEKGIQTVLIGHRGHQELIGTSGYVDKDLLFVVENEEDIDNLDIDPTRPVGYLTQTTLSLYDTEKMVKKLREKYPQIMGASKADICYATQNRQNAVIDLAKRSDVVIICGSPHSSNSNRLRETAAQQGVPAYIIDTVDELDLSWLHNRQRVGISSGASVPRYVVDAVVEKIKAAFPDSSVRQDESIEKNIRFRIPEI